jgi:hypothetical protein
MNGYLRESNYSEKYEQDYDKNVKKIKKLTFTFLTFLREEYGVSRKYLEFIRNDNLNKINFSNSYLFEK